MVKNFYIIGRKDNTIKISGYRVDALELEKIVILNFNITNVILMKISNTNWFLCLAIENKKKIKLDKILKLLKKNYQFILFQKK